MSAASLPQKTVAETNSAQSPLVSRPFRLRAPVLAALLASALGACGGGGAGTPAAAVPAAAPLGAEIGANAVAASGDSAAPVGRATISAVTATVVATVDRFDDRATVAPWTFWAPGGSSGAIVSVDGVAGSNALGLSYSFNCASTSATCGQYVTTTRALPAAVTGAASLQFMTRSPASAKVSVRVVDGSGQTLQFTSTRPPQGYDANVWYESNIDLSRPSLWWGGANSGHVTSGIKQVLFVANAASWPASGTVSIDNVVLLSELVNSGPIAISADTVVDDFGNRAVAAPWTFWTPGTGATGAVVSADGVSGSRGMGLDYSLACVGSTCGKYVQATLPLFRPISGAAALSFSTRSDPSVTVSVRVTDQSGQTLQFTVGRPSAGYVATAWYKAVLDLAQPTLWWGGANTGKLSGAITSIAILAGRDGTSTIDGRLSVDDFTLLTAVPVTAPEALASSTIKTLDNFNDRPTVAPWSFWSPGVGASGSLATTTNPVDASRAMAFNYSLTCVTTATGQSCGSYVVATLPLSPTVSGASWLRMRIRQPVDVGITIRISDTSGQTLDFKVIRPLESVDADNWYTLELDLTKAPKNFWGGANTGKISGAVKSVAIIVGEALTRPAVGSVAIDNVELSTAREDSYRIGSTTTVVAPPDANSQLAPRTGIAVNASASATTLAGLDKAQAAGFKFLRTDLFWSWIETSAGNYNWQAFDGYLAAAEARGFTVQFILCYGNPLYDVRNADGAAAYGRFAAAAARHYAGRKVQFEVWNEPDTAKFWNGTLDQYARASNAGVAGIRSVSASVPVSTGGLSGFWSRDFMVNALKGGIANGTQAVAMHGYRGSAKPETLTSDWLQASELVYRTTGKRVPMWNTEWGYSTDYLPKTNFAQWQAVYGARQMLTQWALDIPLFVHYSLFNYTGDVTNPENNYGVLNTDGSEKPAMQALRTLQGFARDHTKAGLLDALPIGMHAMKLVGANDITYVVWNAESETPLTFGVPASLNPVAYNMNGGTIASTTSTSGAAVYRNWTFKESDGPIYVRTAK